MNAYTKAHSLTHKCKPPTFPSRQACFHRKEAITGHLLEMLTYSNMLHMQLTKTVKKYCNVNLVEDYAIALERGMK